MKTINQDNLANIEGGFAWASFVSGVLCGVGIATAVTGAGIALAVVGCGSAFLVD